MNSPSTKPIHATIITIGDELLIGQTIDTNSAWIATKLNEIGIHVKRRIAVGDVKEDIESALTEESQRCQLIIITGGLGPTADDITKPLLCEYFDGKLVENQEVLAHVKSIFEKRNRPMLESNLKQAFVPNTCTVLFNEAGTAPGMWFEKNEVVFISLPGVPFEMEHIMTLHALPKLKAHFVTPHIYHRTLITAGEGESFIANRLVDFENQLPHTIKLAYLPKLGGVKLRLTSHLCTAAEIDQWFQQLQSILADIVIAAEDIELEEVVFSLLQSRKATLSIAESCTGGLLSAAITSIKGASNIFTAGIVPYATNMKVNLLDIPAELIEQYGVISAETAEAMAKNCLHKTQSTYALSVSGHLEKQKDETYVWIGLADQHRCIAHKVPVFYGRKKNAVFVVNTALNLLRKFMLND